MKHVVYVSTPGYSTILSSGAAATSMQRDVVVSQGLNLNVLLSKWSLLYLAIYYLLEILLYQQHTHHQARMTAANEC